MGVLRPVPRLLPFCPVPPALAMTVLKPSFEEFTSLSRSGNLVPVWTELAADYETHIVVDALSSRFRRDYDVAVERQIRAGAIPTTVEAVLLEWVRTADAPEFQKIRQLIRDPLPE